MRRPPALLCAILVPSLLVPSALDAADGISDLRLAIGPGPGSVTLDETATAMGAETETEDEGTVDAGRLALTYTRAFDVDRTTSGPYWSVGLEFGSLDGELDEGRTVEGGTSLAMASVGWAWRFRSGLHLELAPMIGIGGASGEITGGGGPDIEGSAFYWEVGARFAALWTFASGFQLGAEVRGLAGGTTIEDSREVLGTTVDYEADLAVGGGAALISVGFRL